jgi:putative CRISPR-associated protein (TIGR02620 family)
MEYLIVTRHQGAVEFIKEEAPEFVDAPVLTSVSPDDVRGKTIAGVLPLQLAAEAAEVVAIDFGSEVRGGQDLTVAEMRTAGARLRRYRVTALD